MDIKNECKKRLIKIFQRIGVYLNDDMFDQTLYLDSIQIVSLIIDIESEFMLSIAEEGYLFKDLTTFNDYFKIVLNSQSELLNEVEEC